LIKTIPREQRGGGGQVREGRKGKIEEFQGRRSPWRPDQRKIGDLNKVPIGNRPETTELEWKPEWRGRQIRRQRRKRRWTPGGKFFRGSSDFIYTKLQSSCGKSDVYRDSLCLFACFCNHN
jgi:hypothetical protein